jgi:hypothetical protein
MTMTGGGSTVRRLGLLVPAILLLGAACSSAGPGEQPANAQSPPPSSGYDLTLTVTAEEETEVNQPFALRFRITNAGPDEALGIVTVKDLEHEYSIWLGPGGGGQLVAFDPGSIPGGEEASRKGILRFPRPATATVEVHVAPDEPQDRNPAGNAVTIEVDVSSPACTTRAREGASIENTRRRQVMCTGGRDDTLSAGDQDVVRSAGGDDRVTCTQAFCVLELGRGNDVARCPGACYVNGGPGKDTCPRGESVIRESCER